MLWYFICFIQDGVRKDQQNVAENATPRKTKKKKKKRKKKKKGKKIKYVIIFLTFVDMVKGVRTYLFWPVARENPITKASL